MASLVGIDTSLPLTSLVRGTSLTVLADATAWLGRKPDFVVRPTGNGGGAAFPLTAAEIAFVAAAGVRIAAYMNGSPLSMNNPPMGTYAQGVADAKAARTQMRALGFPDACPIIIDLEHWQVVTAPYVAAVRATEPTAILYGSQQTCGLAKAGGVRSWLSYWVGQADYRNAAGKSPPASAAMWQMAGSAFNGIADEDTTSADVVASFWDGITPPPPSSGPDVPAAVAALTQAESAVAAARRALGG